MLMLASCCGTWAATTRLLVLPRQGAPGGACGARATRGVPADAPARRPSHVGRQPIMPGHMENCCKSIGVAVLRRRDRIQWATSVPCRASWCLSLWYALR